MVTAELNETLFLDFLSEKDMIPISNSVKIPNGFLDSIVTDRSSLLISDAWRSFLFILISFGILMMFIKQKLKKQYVIILLVCHNFLCILMNNNY